MRRAVLRSTRHPLTTPFAAIDARHWIAASLFIAACALQIASPSASLAGGLALFLAGLPHGAFAGDGRLLIVGRDYAIRYATWGVAAALAFMVSPVAILMLFLALSAWHFLHERGAGPRLRRMAIAGLAIGGSALARPDETQAVFAALCGAPIPSVLMLILAIIGVTGYAAALLALIRRPRDVALWVMAAGAVAFHPVLATGLVFMLGHAGPVTARLMRQRGWRPPVTAALGVASALIAGGAMAAQRALELPLPILAAAALAIILPHLLPHSWLAPGGHPRSTPSQRSQAATSPAT